MTLALVACGADRPVDDSTSPVVDDSVSEASIGLDARAIVEATVTIRASGCPPTFALGTASVVDDGLLLTAAHTVAGAERVDVIRIDGDTVSAQVVWFDPDLDLAMLAADTGDATPIPLDGDVDHELGDGAAAIPSRAADGSAVGVVDVEILRHVNIATTDVYRDDEVTRPGFELGVDVGPGDSGALVTTRGVGIGVIWSRSTSADGRAWAVDIPAELTDPSVRATFVEPVDTGRCI